MIKPTVGRVVWFWPYDFQKHDPDFTFYGDQPCSAQIAYVFSDTMVNLSVTDHNGVQHSFTSVELNQDPDVTGKPGTCEWMPYQLGQAGIKPMESES